jgi:hypothetical protein
MHREALKEYVPLDGVKCIQVLPVPTGKQSNYV